MTIIIIVIVIIRGTIECDVIVTTGKSAYDYKDKQKLFRKG